MERSPIRWVVVGAIGAAAGLALVATGQGPGAAKAQTRPAAQAQPATTRPAIDWAKHYHDRVARFETENAAARNIVLVGSSHIEGFDAAKLLPGRRVVNRGISSDRIGLTERGVLHRLEASVFECNPGMIFLENGVNDLGELSRGGKPSMDEIEGCYREVVRRIRSGCPHVPLVVVGLFPVRDRFAGLTPHVQEFNRRLARIAADAGCPFMDVYTPLADGEGLLRVDCSRDGLHLNAAGYRVWAELIEKAIKAGELATKSTKGARRAQSTRPE